jgi:hypothetical protein
MHYSVLTRYLTDYHGLFIIVRERYTHLSQHQYRLPRAV